LKQRKKIPKKKPCSADGVRRLGEFLFLEREDTSVIQATDIKFTQKVINQPYQKMLLSNLLIIDTFLPV